LDSNEKEREGGREREREKKGYLSRDDHGRETADLLEDFVEVGLVGVVDVLLDGL